MSANSVALRNFELEELSWQLANYHGIEIDTDKLWSVVNNDAARDWCLAEDMLYDLVENPDERNKFAQSLYGIVHPVVTIYQPRQIGYPTDVVFLISLLCIVMGYVTGLIVSSQ
jgi:hypothetical protein